MDISAILAAWVTCFQACTRAYLRPMPLGSLTRSRNILPAMALAKAERLEMAFHSACQSATSLPEDTVVSPGAAWKSTRI